MPSARAQDSIIRDIEGLIEADERNPETRQELAKERQGLVTSVSDIKTLKARQQELNALRQEVTQQLNAAFVIDRSGHRITGGPVQHPTSHGQGVLRAGISIDAVARNRPIAGTAIDGLRAAIVATSPKHRDQ